MNEREMRQMLRTLAHWLDEWSRWESGPENLVPLLADELQIADASAEEVSAELRAQLRAAPAAPASEARQGSAPRWEARWMWHDEDPPPGEGWEPVNGALGPNGAGILWRRRAAVPS
jgi:hypothetical protein